MDEIHRRYRLILSLKVSLYTKCLSYNFKKLFELKGYTWFDKGVYNLNIIGIRRANKNKVTNTNATIAIIIAFSRTLNTDNKLSTIP